MDRIDLHVHTTESDGSFTPSEIVSKALDLGLKAIAITDHDTTTGCSEAVSAAAGTGLEVVPGIELSTKYNYSTHILGYYIDTQNKALLDFLAQVVADRDRRNEKLITLLRADGIDITNDEMHRRFGTVIAKPHFAEILVEAGRAPDFNTAIRDYLSKGGCYYIPRTTVPIQTCIELILEAGGIPVLAHPYEYNYSKNTLEELIEYCMSFGLMGIECQHSSHTPEQIEHLERLAEHYGLVKTGGTDFHGAPKPDISLGTGKGQVCVPYEWLAELKKQRK